MALPTLQFLAGLLLLIYLLSFVLFAFIRIATGVSIQRLGLRGLRRIAFTPKDGLRIEIRGLGFTLHRPTFAQPTVVSIVLHELKVTVDLKALGEKPRKKTGWAHWANGTTQKSTSGQSTPVPVADDEDTADDETQRSLTWKRLTDAKDKIKRLHRNINWLRQVDVVAHATTLVIVDVGSVQVGGLNLAVDTRRKTVDRSRLFNHHKPKLDEEQWPAEWLFSARSIFFTPEGRESTELLDHCTLNIHGFLKKELEGLRDASIALKLGRLSIPYDDVKLCMERAQKCRTAGPRKRSRPSQIDVKLTDVMEEVDDPSSREENLVRTVSDSREFASSILRGIHEFQFAVGFFGLTKQIDTGHKSDPPVFLNVSMKEVGMDLLRLDPRSPAHLMYFSPGDIAHQALLAAISISVGIDNSHGHPERLLYIPMATTTLNTTLPSKTIHFTNDKDTAERNTNILFANLVVTSPSLDLDPKHLPLLLAMLHNRDPHRKPSNTRHRKRYLFRRLLPKANIKISVHEPVIRVTLPPMDVNKRDSEEFDLLISSSSSLSLDMESSHAASGELHYALSSTFRMNSHQLYYQTAAIEKHDLLLTDYLELKVQVSASPDIVMEVWGTVQTFSLYLVRPEISEGLRQIATQMQKDVARRKNAQKKHDLNALRSLPAWMAYVHLQGSDFNVEVAGVDPAVSKHSRGIALHLESWTAEYKRSREDETELKPIRRRAPSRTINRDEHFLKSPTGSPKSPKRSSGNPTDGRRLAAHFHGFEGIIIEDDNQSEQEPTLSLPRMEIALQTLSDKQGPIFHVHAYSQSLFLRYSLYRHFALCMAVQVLQRSFDWGASKPTAESKPTHSPSNLSVPTLANDLIDPISGIAREIVTIDIKAQFVQIKADMPSDPPLMLQIYGMEAGKHRWTSPFLRSRLVRLLAENPAIKRAWSRIVSVKSLRLDYRQSKLRYGHTVTDERSFDIATDAIRIVVPHQLVMHKIFDNVSNVTKTVKQVHHRFKTGTDEYVLEKEAEGPKLVPKISVRSRAVLFELEDNAFEWKLGTIYRIGLMEQKQRLAREQAFELKVRKLQQQDEQRGNSRYRARSAHDVRSRNKLKKDKELRFHRRSKSADSSGDDSSPERGRSDHPMRYNKDGFSGLSGSHQTSIKDARVKLNRLNAQTWKKRIDFAMKSLTRTMSDMRSTFWGLDELPDDIEQRETILAVSQRPALMTLAVSDLEIVIDKPSFPISEYPRFLHRVGKGMPFDTQYSLLIPMHVQIQMGEAKIQLRDYPLPLLHFPAIGSIHSSRLPSVLVKTDFVIAEEFRDSESSRVSRVVVVPPEYTENGEQTGGYAVDVRRTVAPVKTYSDMAIDINSAYPTRITWGTSYQPAIQDMMQIIENFTKPAVDPSERVGFWDKIRLTFHSRINVSWKGDGDVHLILKGSRDPYMVTGHGAGFVMCWQNDVQLSLAEDEDPRNFLIVRSGSYVLAIPDLNHYARQEAQEIDNVARPDTSSSVSSHRQRAVFKKTVMKLNGNVKWVAGLVFERNLDDGERSFNFIPHYQVTLKNPKYAKASDGKEYDAFRGFRSHHIHMSIAIAAPHEREWSLANLEPSKTYNSVHLTPRFFTHFFSWWSMFSGAMSLPVRQGKLWPGVEKSSKKFGRHLATIKYNLLLSPLYMSHIYKHKDAEDYGTGVVSATGLKARLDSLMFDLHQRREEFRTLVQAPEGQQNSGQNKTTGMRINQVQLDLIRTDIRAVSASLMGTGTDEVDNATMEDLTSYNQEHLTADLSKFTIPDNDLGWVDMDDFIELGWILPSRRHPETQILPLAFAPRFTYFRQTDHCDNISGDKHRKSAFGNEPTHHCVISARNDPRRVQCHLIEQRIERVKEQVAHNQRAIDQQELKVVRETSEGHEESQRRLDTLRNHTSFLQRKLEFLSAMHASLLERLESTSSGRTVPEPETDGEDEYFEADEDQDVENPDGKDPNQVPSPIADLTNEFNNRFIIHNIHLKWGNSLRNIILRYIHQVSQRRGFVYYMSRRAVKFILDVVEEQNKSRRPSTAGPDNTPMAGDEEVGMSIDETIEQILRDGKNFVNADEEDAKSDAEAGPSGDTGDPSQTTPTKAEEEVADDYLSQNSYLVRLIAPQIQLQSEKDTKSAVLVTAKGMQLKVLSIMDKDRVMDEVSGLVQRRFIALMDSLQIFVTNSKTFSSTDDIHMYSGSSYGSHPGTAWPPWVPFEVMFEFHTNPFGFQRVVQRTSASMRYDKYNALRLKYNDDVSAADNATSTDNKESRIDHLWVDFPHVRALCDSRQYYAMYVIVLDLLLYHEPLEKTRNERLEKIMLASDFTDLAGAPKLVMGLQERIQQLEEIKTVFQINEKYLDKQGWEDRIEVEKDLAVYEDELFFVMKAITTAQRKQDDRAQAKESTGLLKIFVSASDIVWHLLREGAESLAEFQLKNVTFDRTDNNDGSNSNAMEIEQVRGLNLLPNALYPEMISPFLEKDQTLPENAKCLKVYFVALESIAGIPVVEHFEVELYPLKVQLEYQIGKKLLQYIFPTYGDSKTANASPFLLKHSLPDQDGEDGDDFVIASGSATSMNSSMSTDDGATEALKQRLTPTLQLPDPAQKTEKRKGLTKRPSAHYFRFFRENPSRSGTELRRTLHPSSALAGPNGPSSSTQSSRPGSIRSTTTASSQTANESERTAKRFALYRTGTGLTVKGPSKKDARSDDLTEMMSRASEYMTVAYFKVPSMVLCLSYKGKSSRNFEDVHDLVFRMPTIEYRNKTWSNLDLVNQLKKDVLRALLSHAGTIVGNKISNHRPSAKAQSRLRQLANSSAMLNTSPDFSGTESNSMREHSPGGASDISGEDRPPRRSFTSGRQPSVISTVSEEGSSYQSSKPPSTYDRARSTHGSIMGGYSHSHNGLGVDDVEDGRAFADELSRVDNTEPVHANLIHSLSKHLTSVGTPFSGHIRGRAGSGAASTRAASVATGISGMSGVSGREGSVMDEDGAGGDGSSDGPKMQKAKMLGKKLLGRGGN